MVYKMGLPKKIKKDINLIPKKEGLPRRIEMLNMINEHGTFLPKSILHEDLDRGFLDFVKNDLETISEGQKIPVIDIIMTTQNWSNFTKTWEFQNLDKNPEPPFVTTIRNPEVKYGSLPSLLWTIPNRRQYYYASVPTWDGERKGYDVYTIPQPVPVDITYSVKIVCNRMRELNKFNKKVIEKFSSRQAYTNVKGHYIPIIMNEISDESVMDIEKRRYYIQSYGFTLMGFLIDEDEFEVKPAVSRVLQLIETDTKKVKSKKIKNETLPSPSLSFNFENNEVSTSQQLKYTANLTVESKINITSYYVYINGLFYGSNSTIIQVNNGDTLQIDIQKLTIGESSQMNLAIELI
jgi:hypothetical protein